MYLIAIMLAVIDMAAVPRAIYCLIIIMTDIDQATLYMRRLKNLGLFVVVANVVLGLLELILYEYLT